MQIRKSGTSRSLASSLPAPLTPHFPQGPALPLPHQQRDIRSRMQQPRSLTLPSQGVSVLAARPPAPAHRKGWGRSAGRRRDEGREGQGTASALPGYGRTEWGSLSTAGRWTTMGLRAGVSCRAQAEAAPHFPFLLRPLSFPLPERGCEAGTRRDARCSGAPRGGGAAVAVSEIGRAHV